MLDALGDALNWAAAAIVFPLMFLPLAATLGGAKARLGAVAFLLLAGGVAAAGAVFAALAPDLRVRPSPHQQQIFAAALIALTAAVMMAGGPQKATALLSPVFERLARGAGRVVMWFALVMALLQFAAVILRYVFGLNFIFVQESITYLHGAVFLLAGGYVLLVDEHVRVDILYRGASPRRKALIDFGGAYLLLFPVCLAILWAASPYVGVSWAAREGSPEQSGIPALFLLKSCIPAFAILLAMAGFALAARAGETLRKGA